MRAHPNVGDTELCILLLLLLLLMYSELKFNMAIGMVVRVDFILYKTRKNNS